MFFDCLQRFLEKTKEITLGFISGLNNCTAIDRFGNAYYSQSARKVYAKHIKRSLRDR